MTGSAHAAVPAGASVDDRIIAATLALMAEGGLGSLTMMKVAETAGVARQTLYNHYPDVDSIVAEAIGRHNRESIEMLEAALRVVDLPADKLEQLVRHAVAVGVHAHHNPGIEHGLSAGARAMLGEYRDAVEGSIRQVLETGLESGAFREDLSPGIDAALIRHMLDGLAAQAAATPDKAASIATTGVRTVLAAVLES